MIKMLYMSQYLKLYVAYMLLFSIIHSQNLGIYTLQGYFLTLPYFGLKYKSLSLTGLLKPLVLLLLSSFLFTMSSVCNLHFYTGVQKQWLYQSAT